MSTDRNTKKNRQRVADAIGEAVAVATGRRSIHPLIEEIAVDGADVVAP
jgi:hypothetical protein